MEEFLIGRETVLLVSLFLYPPRNAWNPRKSNDDVLRVPFVGRVLRSAPSDKKLPCSLPFLVGQETSLLVGQEASLLTIPAEMRGRCGKVATASYFPHLSVESPPEFAKGRPSTLLLSPLSLLSCEGTVEY